MSSCSTSVTDTSLRQCFQSRSMAWRPLEIKLVSSITIIGPRARLGKVGVVAVQIDILRRIPKSSQNTFVCRSSVVNEPFKAICLDCDATRQFRGLSNTSLLPEVVVPLMRVTRMRMPLPRRILGARLAPNSCKVVSFDCARPVPPCYEPSMNENCLVHAMVTDALEEYSPAK